MANKMRTINVLSAVVICASSLVMIGWFFDINLLKSIVPGFVTMKFSTALSFFFSGLILLYAGRCAEGKDGLSQIVLSIAALMVFLLMATLLASTFLGIQSGIENLFVKEEVGAVQTTVPGRPSVGTMLSFILIAVAAVLGALGFPKKGLIIKVFGFLVSILGVVALAGYVFSQPWMYYTIENVSTAMAVHTAILFVILGVGLVHVGRLREGLPAEEI